MSELEFKLEIQLENDILSETENVSLHETQY